MRVALAQETPRPRGVEANARRACAVIEALAGRADLVAFPELFLAGYSLERLDELALAADDAPLARVRAAARAAGVAAVLGFAERVDSGVANSALGVEADGTVAASYRKTHLFGAERQAFVAGSELQPLPLAGARVGAMVCFDVEFPEVARTLARMGAELLLTISANMAPFELDHEVFVRARALESGLPHAYVNRTGEESGHRFVGLSQIVDADGRLLARAGADPALLEADVGPGGGRGDPRSDTLHQLRPELYAR
jgi:predicted amidohydrolase